ncbi:MAG: flagellar hook-associated protein FlgK [Nocardioides sp.]|nr:flagellar hook-associated protein FlgK [Nocardioides sp.]
MSGTLSSLNTALSAIRYNRVAMDVASNNVANVSTEGYTRRRVVGEAEGAPQVAALWSRYDGAGGGVRTGAIDRLSDSLIVARARTEHGSLAYLESRATSLARLESGVGEPGDSGVAAALADFRSAWQDVGNDPAGDAARTQVLTRAAALADAFHAQAANVEGEASMQRLTMQGLVSEVNTAAAELAETNRAIASARLDGVDVNDMLDTRDRLALNLAELTGGVATERTDGGVDVTVGGVALVTGRTAAQLTIATGVNPDGTSDGLPVTLAVTSGSGASQVTTPLTSTPRGEVGASLDLLTTTLPAYAAGLDALVADFADTINTLHAGAYDLDGNPGATFFTYTPGSAASSLSLAVTDRRAVAVSAYPGGVLDASVADALGTAGQAEHDYQSLVNGLGTEVASSRRLATTQSLLTAQVDSAHEQLAGVNLDEEMVSMLSAQRAYEAAARVMTVVDSVLDTLINRTGVTR